MGASTDHQPQVDVFHVNISMIPGPPPEKKTKKNPPPPKKKKINVLIPMTPLQYP